MKRLNITLFLVLISIGLTAQTTSLKSKKGHEILPQKGDIALGFNAVPLITLGLNAINITGDNVGSPAHPGYISGFDQIISGKYFLSESMAIRAKIGVNTLRTSNSTFGPDLSSTETPQPDILRQTDITNKNTVFLGGGLEWRRGHNRLQGYYGGEAFLSLGNGDGSSKTNYEMEYNTENQDLGYFAPGDSRILEDKNGLVVGFGVRGFIGVEYFVAPKISIGGEFGWGMGLTTTPKGTNVTESWDGTDVTTTTTDGQTSGNEFQFQVDNGIDNQFGGSGAIMVHFHF